MDKQLNKLVEQLIKTAVSEITTKLPAIVKETIYRQLEQVFKTQSSIQDDLGRIREDLNGFDKRLSDLQIVVDTIDSRATQIKATQDKQPLNMQKNVTNAINDAVNESVPPAMTSVLAPSKKKFKIKKRTFWNYNIKW